MFKRCHMVECLSGVHYHWLKEIITFTRACYIDSRRGILLFLFNFFQVKRPSLNHRLSIYMMYPLDSFVSISYQLWHNLMQFCFCILHFGLCCVLVCRVSIKARLSVSFREMKIPTAFTREEMSFWEEFFLCIPAPYHLFLLSRQNLSQPSINCVSCFHNLIDVL